MTGQQNDNIGMQFFRPQSVALLTMRDGKQGWVGMARVQGRADPKPLDPHKVEDAFLFVLSQKRVRSELTFDGHCAEVCGDSESKVTAYDYRHRWTCIQHTDFELFNWHIPRSSFALVAPDYSGGAAFKDLSVRPGVNVEDATAQRLAALIAPAFDTPAFVNNLFVDHVSWAAIAHFAQTYGEFVPQAPRTGPQLSTRQLRTAKEMIAANLSGDVRLEELAGACRLSVSYFARAFRNSTGFPPHRWLLQRRIETAQNLLSQSGLSLATVALDCGFFDQSHFAKVFRQIVGTTPAEWRRSRHGQALAWMPGGARGRDEALNAGAPRRTPAASQVRKICGTSHGDGEEVWAMSLQTGAKEAQVAVPGKSAGRLANAASIRLRKATPRPSRGIQ